ncbi:MAG: TraB/GumN family protein [Gammaproteobacteria bacterium]|jgi:uncharacterized protein YbaP (TraB family)|nr:TraB/GumN family protein [Gammaproteobacteria bacterium]
MRMMTPVTKRLARFVFWLTVGLASAAAVAKPGLLFEIDATESGAPPCYLFGTIHSEDPRVLSLTTPAQAAFDQSTVFIMETIPDTQAVIRAMMAMVYTDGRGLAQVAGRPLYEQTVQALAERGMAEEAIKDYKPWAAATLLGMPEAGTGEFLDIRLYKAALAAGKQVQGLESIEEQLAVFDTLTEEDQIALLRETLEARPTLPEVFARLLEAYLSQDLARLERLGDEYLRRGDPQLAARFRHAALEVRNQHMTARMLAYLRSGGCFIAIGALHLPGEDGVLARLVQAGFTPRALD